MADLSVKVGPLSLANPLILASSTPGWDGEHLRRVAAAGIGAVIPKSIGPPAEWAQHPRCGRIHIQRVNGRPVGMINTELFTTLSPERWLGRDLKLAYEGGVPVIASVVAMPDREQTAELAAAVEETGYAEMVEINVSCPMPSGTVGMHIGRDPALVGRQVDAVRRKIKLPIAVKLTPNVASLVDVARAAEDAGAGALSVSNSIRAFAGVDVETGRPYLPAFGGYTGPAVKPIIQRHLIEIKMSGCSLALIAVGGVSDWRDVVEYLMLGADAVQLATAIMWHGCDIIPRICTGLGDYLQRRGLESLADIRGVALAGVRSIEDYAQEPARTAQINSECCKGCGICEQVCLYDAITGNPIPRVDPRRCDGCGLCAEMCPSRCIRLVR